MPKEQEPTYNLVLYPLHVLEKVSRFYHLFQIVTSIEEQMQAMRKAGLPERVLLVKEKPEETIYMIVTPENIHGFYNTLFDLMNDLKSEGYGILIHEVIEGYLQDKERM